MADPERKGELDEAKLERELLEDFEIETLHEWRSSHPKSTIEAGETSISSPVLNQAPPDLQLPPSMS